MSETKALLDQMVAYDAQLSELRLKRTDLDRLYTRQHPASAALSQQISQIERMETMNPRRPASLSEEEAIRRFLEGEAEAPKPAAKPTKHGGHK